MGMSGVFWLMTDARFLRIMSVRNPLARMISGFLTLNWSSDPRTEQKRNDFQKWLRREVIAKPDSTCERHLSSVREQHTDWHYIPQHCKFGVDQNMFRFQIVQLERSEQLRDLLLAKRPELKQFKSAKPFFDGLPKHLLLHVYEIVNLRWFFGGPDGLSLLDQALKARTQEIKHLGYEDEIREMRKMFALPVKWTLEQNGKQFEFARDSPSSAVEMLRVFRKDY
jgi:hypothetical protein